MLTGSANVLDMKKAKERLAGRIIEIPMYPLSQKEIANKPDDNIIDILFTEGVEGLKLVKKPYTEVLEAILDIICKKAESKELWQKYLLKYQLEQQD